MHQNDPFDRSVLLYWTFFSLSGLKRSGKRIAPCQNKLSLTPKSYLNTFYFFSTRCAFSWKHFTLLADFVISCYSSMLLLFFALSWIPIRYVSFQNAWKCLLWKAFLSVSHVPELKASAEVHKATSCFAAVFSDGFKLLRWTESYPQLPSYEESCATLKRAEGEHIWTQNWRHVARKPRRKSDR